MKKLLPGIFAIVLFYSTSYSQYCGHTGNPSGVSQCTSTGALTQPGFTPNEDIPCINRSQFTNIVLDFKNFDTIRFGGQTLTTQSLRIDSIGNLPDGLCWVTNKANNTYANQESGCLKISGVTTAPPGQYLIKLIITVNVGINITTDASAANMFMYLRVIDQSFSFCPPIDTSQTSSTPYQPFNGNYQNVAQISGKLYYDANQNGTYENGELGIPGKIVNVGSTYVAASNALGNFHAYVPAGTYTLKPAGSLGFPYSPDSIVVDAPNVATNYVGSNFGVLIPADYCEGFLSIVSQSPPPRPGFNNHMLLQFHNTISANPVSQTIKFTYNGGEVFVSANPAPTTIDTVGRFITWDVTNIAANSKWTADVIFYNPPPPATAIGDIRYYSSNVINSTCGGMDTVHTRQEVTVVGSYDPNDKAVSPAGLGAGGRVLPSTEPLSYTIRFQNTGTYPAENVKVIDTMSNLVNMATFKLIATSHPCEVFVNGRVVTFAFNGIQLADSFNNEPMSHGYIQYSIRPNTGFVHNTVIENLADIYFDFNAPIRTNTTRTTGDAFIGISKISEPVLQFDIYPNPISGNVLQLVVDPQLVGKDAELMDVNGKLLSRSRVSAVNSGISIKDLPAGVYLVKVGAAVKRLVRE
ncbi:MAG TPA: T9SS type A sorting domain-containing protein [Chitinophagales bacterium]|nr:T9SS type A sorting domain-containing protein [Chitinophagales bacterium]